MPDVSNQDSAKQVGQDQATHDVERVYDRDHGTYKDQPPAVNAGTPNDQISAPFSVGGGK